MLVKGAGDVATGVAKALLNSGFRVVMTEIAQPTTERRGAAFSEAVYEGEWEVEGTRAKRTVPEEIDATIAAGKIPIIVDPNAEIRHRLKPEVLVDAIMAKRNTGTKIDDAPIVIGLGPGFEAGRDVDAVIETSEGPNLGRPYYKGTAQPFHGIPCNIGGMTHERVLRAPGDGVLRTLVSIGDHVEAGQVVATVGEREVKANISGVLRGIMRDGLTVKEDHKIGDIDPRDEKERCFMVAERSVIIGEGVLEAIKVLRAKAAASRQREQPRMVKEER
ncbi:EF2563 family selenium-dependent molybdenum hydroxylase system protein [Candidatus Bathyarchaeota archaeon]|nr:EF2563 family selenium-dependent molybdenum hydroxylase system protein [Candidatus Bathyarchaeota archaeon]